MKSIANQYRDLKEGRMSQANFMRNLRMTMPQFVTNVTSFGDAIKILKNKSILTENTNPENQPSEEELAAMDGVQKATVDFDSKKATVVFDKTIQSQESLTKVVEATADGKTYKVVLPKS